MGVLRPTELHAAIRGIGRRLGRRGTLCQTLREFSVEAEAGEAASGPLDLVVDPSATFGSYAGLVADESVRYEFVKPARP